jgi:hypothetical protein
MKEFLMLDVMMMMEARMEVFVSSLEGEEWRELFLKVRTYNRLVVAWRTCMWNRYDRTIHAYNRLVEHTHTHPAHVA